MIRNLMTAATIAMLTATIASAEMDMAFAKTTVPLKIEGSSVGVFYMMNDEIKSSMQGIIDKVIQEKAPSDGYENVVVIRPVVLSEYSTLYDDRKVSEPIPAVEIDIERIKELDSGVSVAEMAGVGVKGFVKGATAYGAGMEATTVSGGLSDMASQGLFTLGAGLLVGGTAAWMAGDDEFVMVTDVYVNDKRTRVFAFVNDSDIKPEEAVDRLSRLTAGEIAAMVKG